jgi:hypothetical protein
MAIKWAGLGEIEGLCLLWRPKLAENQLGNKVSQQKRSGKATMELAIANGIQRRSRALP